STPPSSNPVGDQEESTCRAPSRSVACARSAESPATDPPAILLHGWGCEGASLHPLATHLAQRFRTITPDLPGFGGTTPPPDDWGVPEYASWTLQLLDKLGIGRALLLGHSNGGRIAIYLAATQPAIVDRLILVDSAGIRPDGTTTRQAVAAISKTGRAAST